MEIERDETSGACYYRLIDVPVDHTVSVTDLTMVDVDELGRPVGVELAVDIERLTDDEKAALFRAFPRLRMELPWEGRHRPRDSNRLAASIVADATGESAELPSAIPVGDFKHVQIGNFQSEWLQQVDVAKVRFETELKAG